MLLIPEHFIPFPEFRVHILKCQGILGVKHLTLPYLFKGLILSLAISKQPLRILKFHCFSRNAPLVIEHNCTHTWIATIQKYFMVTP